MSDCGLSFVLKLTLFSDINFKPRNTDLLNWGISIASDPDMASSGTYTGPRRAMARQVGSRLFLDGIIPCTLYDLVVKNC